MPVRCRTVVVPVVLLSAASAFGIGWYARPILTDDAGSATAGCDTEAGASHRYTLTVTSSGSVPAHDIEVVRARSFNHLGPGQNDKFGQGIWLWKGSQAIGQANQIKGFKSTVNIANEATWLGDKP